MARNFSRGTPPPPGSFEYLAVGDMWYPEIAARKMRAAQSGIGVKLYEISFTDLDAAQNFVDAIDRGVKQARQLHGDKIISREDERQWDALVARWRPFAADMRLVPGSPSMMVKENKLTFDQLVGEAHKLAEGFAKKGMSPVPVPYAGELVLLLRQMPKKMTAAEMQRKLLAGVKCGERLLDTNTVWFDWIASRDHLPLKKAVEDARSAADIYGRSRAAKNRYAAGDPVYDEFMRRLALIWVEAAGLHGIKATQASASAELKDAVRKMPSTAGTYLLGLLAIAGVGYLGASWVMKPRQEQIAVGVPDAYPNG
jgi:hypothetical protein